MPINLEQKSAIENNESLSSVHESVEKELTKSELLEYAEKEKSAFVEETANEISLLNSVDLAEDDFDKLKTETKIEEELKEINAEAEKAIDDVKSEISNESKEQQEVDGIDFIFEQHPELEKIGTKEQYKQYIENIFPKSQVKDILYHYSSYDKIKEEGFKFFTETGVAAGAGDIEAIWLTKKAGNYWGENVLNKYAAVINADKPLDARNSVSEEDEAIKEYHRLWEIGTDKEYDYSDLTKKWDLQKNRKLAFKEAGYDSILSPDLEEVAIFDKENIHILGSSSDLEKFSEFVEEDKK